MFCFAVFTVKSFESNRTTSNNNNKNATGDVFHFSFHSLSLTFGFWRRFMAIRIYFCGNAISFELMYLRPPTFHSPRAQHRRLQLWATERNPQFPIIRRCAMSVVVFDGQSILYTNRMFFGLHTSITTMRVCCILPTLYKSTFFCFLFF